MTLKTIGWATFRYRRAPSVWGLRRVLVVLECEALAYGKTLRVHCGLGRAELTLKDAGFFQGTFVLASGEVEPFRGRLIEAESGIDGDFQIGSPPLAPRAHGSLVTRRATPAPMPGRPDNK